MATEEVVEKATAAFIVSLIAGILILMNALMFVALAHILEELEESIPIHVFDIFASLAAVGAILGVLVIIGAILIYTPGNEKIGGVIVLVFSILSIVIGGGFFLGLILGIIGGALGIAHQKVKVKPTRTCLGCGMQIPVDYAVCPHCGKKKEEA